MDDLAALSLADIARMAEERRLPPVEKWQPTHCGDSEMRIARAGTSVHQGSRIRPRAMGRGGRGPDGCFVLVTPVEKLDIVVEDAPFVAVEVKSEVEGEARTLAFRLNTGDLVIAGPGHALRFERVPHPYLEVRGGLDALVARPVYYELAELALAQGANPLGLWSGGLFFALEPAA